MAAAAYGDDLMLALAQEIVNGDEDEAETVESVFAQARDTEATAEKYLFDEDWQAPEPDTRRLQCGPQRGSI